MPAPASYRKPLPIITATNAPYWRALRERQVKLQRCRACGAWIWPISPACQSCWSESYVWEEVSGRGVVTSWVRYHKAFDPVYAEDLPYNVIQVDLREGVRLISNLITDDDSKLRSGVAVEPVFDDVTPELTLLKFRPAGEPR